MEVGKRLIGNSAFLFIDWLIITVLSLVFWIIVGKTLSKEEYGIVATATNIIIILSGISLLGVQTTLTKMIPEMKERNQPNKIGSLIRFATRLGLVMSVAIGSIVVASSGYLSPVLKLPQDAIVMSGIGIVVFSMWSLSTSILQGFQTMKKLMLTDLVGNTVKVVATLALSWVGFSYFGPIAAVIVAILVVTLMRIDIFIMGIRKRSERPGIDKRAIWVYSLSAFTISIAVLGFANTPNIILNALTTPAVTGLFAVALTITSPILSIPSVMNIALFPITSGLSVSRKNNAVQKKLINMVLRLTAFITLPVIAMLLIFSDTVILFFSSPEFLGAMSILPVLGAASFIFGIGGILSTTLYAIGKPTTSRNITILTLTIFILTSVPLSMSMHAMGMAIAYLVSVTVFTAASLFYLRKCIGLRIDIGPLLKVMVASLIFSGILFVVDYLDVGTAVKFAGAAAASVAYLCILAPLRFYNRDDIRVLDAMSQRSPIARGVFYRMSKILSRWAAQ